MHDEGDSNEKNHKNINFLMTASLCWLHDDRR
jgi:hypothetical protein